MTEEQKSLYNLNKSTENLSKIEDKDKWLDEVKGKEESFVDIAKPVGDFIFDQSDILGTPGNDGMYYHYSQVCRMLRRYPDYKLEELEDWIKNNTIIHDAFDTGVVDILELKSKIQSLK